MPAAAGWYDDGSGRERWWDGQQWTPYFRAPSPPAPPSRHLWWALSPVYSCGLVSFIPALHAAIKLRRRELWWWAIGLIVGSFIGWGLVGTGPRSADGTRTETTLLQTVGSVIIIVLGAIGTIHAFRIRDSVFPREGEVSAPVPQPLDPAIVNSLAARQRRAESRALSEQDPALARDLSIGRPDRAQQYDDGGLVDVNHVPAEILVSHLGLSQDQARLVIEAREYVGGFESVEDLLSLAALPPRLFDEIRDRVVAL